MCTAGITEEGEWIRLFPIPFRFLDDPKQFRKYDWIEAKVMKARSDPRAESYIVDVDSIQVVDKIKPESTEGVGRVSVLKKQKGAPLNLG